MYYPRITAIGLLIFGTLFSAAPSTGPIFAQSAPAPSSHVVRRMDSGTVTNMGTERRVLASFSVEEPGAIWMRLYFDEISLGGDERSGKGSYLRITSMADGASHLLHASHAAQWQNSSAYMNGDAVLVELIGEPGSGESRMRLKGYDAGFSVLTSICGAADDRVLSSDPRSARAMPVGCTAWLISDCGHCFLTAGHCMSGGSLNVVQFNVPLSTSTGGLQNPPPEHQYAVDPVSRQFVNGGVGNDWGYFGCFANSNTGLKPFQAQGAAHVIATPPPFNSGLTMRITGYGTDSSPSSSNQVQQTHNGPYFALSGTALQHQADTTGGNSGSAVQWEQGGVAVAIHTHAGCNSTSTGGNSATSIANAGLQAALGAPLGVCNTTCSASLTPYCTAKVNSLGCTPQISSVGTPSATSPAPFLVTASNILNQKSGMLVYSLMSAATPFQGGTLCVASPLVRTSLQSSGGDSGVNNCSGAHTYDMRARIQGGLDPNLRAGTTVYAQWLTRDVLSPSGPLGLTAALAVTIGP